MKQIVIILAVVFGVSTAASAQEHSDPKADQLISKLQTAIGGKSKLFAQKDVQFQYEYRGGDGKYDMSTERYRFAGELSWAKYATRDLSVMVGTPGQVMQAYDGRNDTARVTVDGKALDGDANQDSTRFLRKANFFWFVMMFKLSDDDVIAKHTGTETIDGINYDVVSISYRTTTGNAANDSYVLYINPTTHLVDEFYFSLPAMGLHKPVIKTKVSYESVNGLQLPTRREMFMPGKDGTLPDTPSVIQISRDIKFNNGFSDSDFRS